MDKNLYDTLQILNDLRIKYFCTCGTMLGLYRDGDVIPWDKDIDIAVFLNSKDYHSVFSSMKNKGFEGSFQRTFRPGKPTLKFTRAGGRKVEFSTPTLNASGEYCFEWYECASPKKYDNLKFYQKTTHHLLKTIGRLPFQETQVGIQPCSYIDNKIKKIICLLTKNIFSYLPKLNYWIRKIIKIDTTIGYYSNKIDPEKTAIIDYYGIDCLIPADTEGVCIDFYGTNWRVPKDMSHYSDFYKNSLSKRFINDV